MFHGISMSGFDDQVWDNLIKTKREAVILKTKMVPNFNKMLALFARDGASGENAKIAKEKNAQLSKTVDIKVESIAEVDDLLASNDGTLENHHIDGDEDDIQVVSPTCFSPKQNSSAKKCKSKKRKFVDEIEPELEPETFETKIMNVVACG
uniref:Uncharacterized protein n=1 Tax=Lactuca sativa TaxID=4236 RepID=A0A9R1VX73_LACSA|nr:hypothetical protein LSAT_V11C400180800 [Lactuca sativa]